MAMSEGGKVPKGTPSGPVTIADTRPNASPHARRVPPGPQTWRVFLCKSLYIAWGAASEDRHTSAVSPCAAPPSNPAHLYLNTPLVYLVDLSQTRAADGPCALARCPTRSPGPTPTYEFEGALRIWGTLSPSPTLPRPPTVAKTRVLNSARATRPEPPPPVPAGGEIRCILIGTVYRRESGEGVPSEPK